MRCTTWSSTEGRPPAVTLAAIDVLFGYAQPSAALQPFSGPPDVSFQVSSAADGRNGGQPLGSPVVVVAQVWSTLAEVASAAAPEVAARARHALNALAVDERVRLAAWDPSVLTLTYVCGNRFRLQSQHSMGITLTYDVRDVPGTLTEVGVPAYGATVFTAPAAGRVRLSYLGTVIAAKDDRGKGCEP